MFYAPSGSTPPRRVAAPVNGLFSFYIVRVLQKVLFFFFALSLSLVVASSFCMCAFCLEINICALNSFEASSLLIVNLESLNAVFTIVVCLLYSSVIYNNIINRFRASLESPRAASITT